MKSRREVAIHILRGQLQYFEDSKKLRVTRAPQFISSYANLQQKRSNHIDTVGSLQGTASKFGTVSSKKDSIKIHLQCFLIGYIVSLLVTTTEQGLLASTESGGLAPGKRIGVCYPVTQNPDPHDSKFAPFCRPKNPLVLHR
jgi:hypothetical protein